MVRKTVALLGTMSLVFVAAACSDDDVTPDTGTPDTGADIAVADAGVETSPDSAVDAAVEAAPQHSVLLGLAELEGRASYVTPGPDAGPPIKLLSPVASLPDPSLKPDFIDGPAPPNCYVYKWTATAPPNRSDVEAGKVTITGHVEALYVNGASATPTPKKLPKIIECTRKQIATTGKYMYDCGLPKKTVLVAGSALTDTSAIDIEAAGGKDITAFKETAITPGPQVKPKSTFDLYKIDPAAGVTAEWETTTALLVSIRLTGALKDGSETAEIVCSTLGAAGSKAIPKAALDLLPKGTNTNPLIITTAITGFNLKGTTAKWGSYKVGAGRGTFGVSCRLAATACP
jgi:hypothetical protein